jgi:hypothetical protein
MPTSEGLEVKGCRKGLFPKMPEMRRMSREIVIDIGQGLQGNNPTEKDASVSGLRNLTAYRGTLHGLPHLGGNGAVSVRA